MTDRRRHAIELAVFFVLIFPSMWLSAAFSDGFASTSFVPTAVLLISRDIGLTALTVFLVWGGGEALSSIGWVRAGATKNAVHGALLFVVVLPSLGVLGYALKALGLSLPTSRPEALQASSPAELVLATVLVAVVAISEETVFRGYLLRRIREFTSTPMAVAITSLLFASGHIYEGLGGAIVIGVLGAACACAYLWRRSLVTPIVLHFVQDFVVLVIAPQLL